jgi:hypothetical protein
MIVLVCEWVCKYTTDFMEYLQGIRESSTGINGIRGGIGLLTTLSQSFFFSVNPCTCFSTGINGLKGLAC